MGIVIRRLNSSNIKDINKADDEFIVDSKAVLRYEKDRLSYTVVPVPPYPKKYRSETAEFYRSFIDAPDRVAFLAYLDGEVAGQLLMHTNWNRFAWIDDIGVDKKFRRKGIGRALLKEGEVWAREKNYPGIMLETQDTNVGACRFYEKCGFVLGGFDTHLYRAGQYADEIALFWYFLF